MIVTAGIIKVGYLADLQCIVCYGVTAGDAVWC